MATEITFTGIDQLIDRLSDARDIIEQEQDNMADELGEIGVDAMQEKFDRSDRGRKYTRAAQRAGYNQGPGRNRFGAMYDAIDYRVDVSSYGVDLTVGYVSDNEDYFEYQEEGFETMGRAAYTRKGELRFWKDGEPMIFQGKYPIKIPGVFALRAARRAMNSEMPRLIKKYKSRITKRINGTL